MNGIFVIFRTVFDNCEHGCPDRKSIDRTTDRTTDWTKPSRTVVRAIMIVSLVCTYGLTLSICCLGRCSADILVDVDSCTRLSTFIYISTIAILEFIP